MNRTDYGQVVLIEHLRKGYQTTLDLGTKQQPLDASSRLLTRSHKQMSTVSSIRCDTIPRPPSKNKWGHRRLATRTTRYLAPGKRLHWSGATIIPPSPMPVYATAHGRAQPVPLVSPDVRLGWHPRATNFLAIRPHATTCL